MILKWYFALNEASLSGKRLLWERLITAAVNSAARNTSLKPHLIYDGGEDPFINHLARRGVQIVRHKATFSDALLGHSPADPMYERIAGGAFLRTELPIINVTDEVVLYTDCDVIFEQDPRPREKPCKFACAPEFSQPDYVNFNTGVMLMNLPALRVDIPDFTHFIRHNLARFLTFDQDAYRQFYSGKIDKLPLEMNWKPYWGENAKAEIVHFHGPKPDWVRRHWAGGGGEAILLDIVSWKPEGYQKYVPLWEGYADQPIRERNILSELIQRFRRDKLAALY